MSSSSHRFGSPVVMSDGIVQEFQNFLTRDGVRRYNFLQQPFYRPDDIKDWLSHTNAQGVTNEVKLLEAVHQENFFPVSREIAHVRLIFALLVSMGCGHMIGIFLKHIDSDSDLKRADLRHPFMLIIEALRRDAIELPPNDQYGTYQSVIDTFDKRRWAFAPALIEKGMDITLCENQVLPFFAKNVINAGGTATVHHCKVQTDLVCSDLKNTLRPSKNDDMTGLPYYEVAVKTYMPGFQDIYRQETNAFKGMQGQEGLGVVKHLGEYRAHSDNGQHTDNILLEFGEQDLDEYLADAGPPILNKEIIGLWQSLFEVAETLQGIHQFKRTCESRITQQFNGWHGDVKPDNILRIRGKFKLADFGFAQFEKQDIRKTQLKGGTRTYGAPERDIKSRSEGSAALSQTVDTWSFGCVMSAVATWLILGQSFYAYYGKIREEAIEKLREQHKSNGRVSTPDADDGFHDGREVLRAVLDWHKHLRNSARKADTISYRVLDLVDQEMLISDPEKRLPSSELCDKLRTIVHEAREEYILKVNRGELVPESEDTLEALLKLDQYSPSVPTPMNQTSTRQNSHANASTPSSHTVNYSHFQPSNRVGKSERIGKMRIGKTANRENALTSEHRFSHHKNSGSGYDTHSQPPMHPSQVRSFAPTKRWTQPVASDWAAGPDPSYSSPRISVDAVSLRNINASPYNNFPIPQPVASSAASMVSSSDRSASFNNHGVSQNSPVSPYPPDRNPQTPTSDDSMRPVSGVHTAISHGSTPVPSLNHLQSHPPGSYAILEVYKDKCTKVEGVRGKFFSFMSGVQNDPYLENFLHERDIKFVIDNAESMRPHWSNVKKTVLALAMTIGSLDKDGLDLIYASSLNKSLKNVKPQKIQTEFRQSIKNAFNSTMGVKTNMHATLTRIFDEYLKNPSKSQTIIILTDGLWEGSTETDDVERVIRKFVNDLNQREGRFELRRFSIQFITFGENAAALKRLQDMDDDLGAVEDVVDVKPWHFPNVNSLILGSVTDHEDGKDEMSSVIDLQRQSTLSERNTTAKSSRPLKGRIFSSR